MREWRDFSRMTRGGSATTTFTVLSVESTCPVPLILGLDCVKHAWASHIGLGIAMVRKAVVLSHQSFPANVPSADGGECLRVMRVEDGSLQKLTAELLQVLKRNMVVPGMVIMLGSLTQLGKYGTAWYAAEWIRKRNMLKRELGDVLVVPLLPLVSVAGVGSHVVRSLLEFLNWIDDLQDPEMELLRGVRRQYMAEFLSPVEGGQPFANERQSMMLPISLYGEGVMLYKSREWGLLPRELRPVSEDEESHWIGKLSTAMSRKVNISLATTMATGRTLSAVRSMEENAGQMVFRVARASNAARTVAAMTRKGKVWAETVEPLCREGC